MILPATKTLISARKFEKLEHQTQSLIGRQVLSFSSNQVAEYFNKQIINETHYWRKTVSDTPMAKSQYSNDTFSYIVIMLSWDLLQDLNVLMEVKG